MYMKRVNYHLTEKQIEILKKEAKITGLSIAEIIRRALDVYFYEKTKQTK